MSEAPFIEFLESHRPPLEAGKYRIAVAHGFAETLHAKRNTWETFGGRDYTFAVAGPKYTLAPQDIAAVFPPRGSLGDHSHVFPHVALRRSTLPWERSGNADETGAELQSGDWRKAPAPWLALLVYDKETDELESKDIRSATTTSGGAPLKVGTLDASDADYPSIADTEEQDTVVAAVDVRTAKLDSFLPTAMESRLLCHVRRNILFSIDWPKPRAPTLTDLSDRFPQEIQLTEGLAKIEPADKNTCWRLVDDTGRRSFLLWANAAEKTLQVTDEDAAEYAFVIGNRLPAAGKTTVVHLISLEGRFDAEGRLSASGKDYTRFVSLHQWTFSCESHQHTFEGLLLHLNQMFVTDGPNAPAEGATSATEQIPPHLTTAFARAGVFLSDQATVKKTPKVEDGDFDLWTINDFDQGGNSFAYTLRRPKAPHSEQRPDLLHVSCDSPATVRLPRNRDEKTEFQLAAGFTLLPHQFRDGSRSFSWYRGPLAPGPMAVHRLSLPVECSDALLVYEKASGLFYTGYAAAWELGRLLCLANSRISQALYQWKREHRRLLRQTDSATLEKLALLPVKAPPRSSSPEDSAGTDLPQVVVDWFASLRRLEPVPFRYLVPDERMLPVESIRFFRIDHFWVNSLVDGAFSIGRVLEGDHTHDQTLHREHVERSRRTDGSDQTVTGLLLRSAVVSGWPLMTVDGLGRDSTGKSVPHERLRFDRLAPDILLCLFRGRPTRFEVHLPKETAHFGVDPGDEGSAEATLPWRERKALNAAGVVLRGGRLRLEKMPPATFNPASFAHAMIEGVPKVVFAPPLSPPAPPGPVTVVS